MCMIRLLAEDESRADRELRRIDLALLDAVTWPEFVWEWLRLVGVQSTHSLPQSRDLRAPDVSQDVHCRIGA